MPFDPPLMCPWRCYEIGGPWIAENPDCPFHGRGINLVDLEELDQMDGERMCREELELREQRELKEREYRDLMDQEREEREWDV